jgi:NhaC family Na+:H+ antiporter
VFGNATLDGASQVSLLAASAVSVLIGHFSKRLEWENLEKEITDKIASCTPAIIILLLIGAIGGTWMVSGTPLFTHIRYMMYTTVPTFIVSLSIFLIAGLMMDVQGHGNVQEFMDGLQHTFCRTWMED